MAVEGLVTLPLASLGPRIWAEPAVEGGRMTVDESLTALPRPVSLRPLLEQHALKEGPLSHLRTEPRWGSSNSSAVPRQGAHLVPSNPEDGAAVTLGTCRGCALPHAHAHTYLYKCTVPDNLTPHPLQFLLCRFNLSQLS